MKIRIILLALLLLFFTVPLFSGIPGIFNYQGIFIDSNGRGEEIKDTLSFKLYNRAAGGIELWQESHYIETDNGIFSVSLGSKNKINPETIINTDSLFLEIIKLGITGSRMRINSILYAFKSAYAESSGISQRAVIADSATSAFKTDSARFADSARVAGQKIWQKNGTNCFFLDGNVSIGTDTVFEKFNIKGNLLVHNDTGDANIYIKAKQNPSLCFKKQSGTNADSRVKLVYYNGGLYINMWDTSGANEIPGVIKIQRQGTVLEAKGGIKADSFMVGTVTLNVPDYVFQDGYNLLSVNELEDFIKTKNHLPNIPSAKTIKQDGLNLLSMNMKLLEKIEELTLYIINQEKRIKKLEENAKL